MTTSIPMSAMHGAPGAKFEKIGDKYLGKIVSIDERHQTDPDGTPKTFPDGTPKPEWVITVKQADGESVALYARGGKFKPAEGTGEAMLNAIGTAVRAADADGAHIGARLAVTHTGLGEPTKPGFTAPKLFTAQYEPPSTAVPVDPFSK
jgi:hypothetical protein